MQMSPTIARAYYKEYRKKVREHRALRLVQANKDVAEGGKRFRAGRIAKSLIEKEDETLMEAYRVMAAGQRIINVASVLKAAGRNAQELPKLALAGAHWKYCYLTWCAYKQHFQVSEQAYGAATNGKGSYMDGASGFPMHVFGAELFDKKWREAHSLPQLPAKALVPIIPPELRPAGDLSGYNILFEAVWEAAPPVDPLLLRRVHGDIYSVVAQWNLTDIERSVLEGRIA
jgi:hypothetical protein